MSHEFKRVVVCAACKIDDIVFCGARHFDAIIHKQINAAFSEVELMSLRRDIKQGFIDNQGNFLTRTEALEVAKQAGQIKFKHPPAHKLFSEDLY